MNYYSTVKLTRALAGWLVAAGVAAIAWGCSQGEIPVSSSEPLTFCQEIDGGACPEVGVAPTGDAALE